MSPCEVIRSRTQDPLVDEHFREKSARHLKLTMPSVMQFVLRPRSSHGIRCLSHRQTYSRHEVFQLRTSRAVQECRDFPKRAQTATMSNPESTRLMRATYLKEQAK
jgi:hypothetical protein